MTRSRESVALRAHALAWSLVVAAVASVGCDSRSGPRVSEGARSVVTTADAGANDAAAPADSSPDAPSTSSTFTATYEDVVVRTTRTLRAGDPKGVAISSVVITTEGDEVFQADVLGLPPSGTATFGTPEGDADISLRWTNLGTGFTGEMPMGKAWRLGEPTLESAAAGAYFLYKKLPETEDGPVPMNNAGCDSPADPLSCGTAGRCCDIHDQCYFDNGCTAAKSWPALRKQLISLAPLSPCAKCNLAAVGCIAFAAKVAATSGTPPGKSVCCDDDSCGTPTCRMNGNAPVFSPCTCNGVSCEGACSRVDGTERCDGTTTGDPIVCGGAVCRGTPARCPRTGSFSYSVGVPYCDDAGACAVRDVYVGCGGRGCRATTTGIACDIEPDSCGIAAFYPPTTCAGCGTPSRPGWQGWGSPTFVRSERWVCCERGARGLSLDGQGYCVRGAE